VSGSPAPKATAVWTDFGGVLTPPISHTMGVFCDKRNLDPDALFSAIIKVTASYGTDDYMEPIDTPLVTEAEWLGQIGDVLREDHGITGLQLTTLADDWFDGRETNDAWVAQLRKVRSRGLFVGMLSNMVPTWDQHWRRMVDATELFDDVVLSFQAGYRKPAAEMFELAAKRAGVPAAECVLVDDNQRNCAGAEAAGWRAIHFTDTGKAIAELDELVGAGETAGGKQ
jgi:putative hydrolase of the HAD superfamily